MRTEPRLGAALVAAMIGTIQAAPLPAAVAPPAAGAHLLVVLAETGATREELPVLSHHPDPRPIERALSTGFSARLLRLYRWHQTALARASGAVIEPAYLLLSSRQGGFPRFGFYLGDERKASAGYVDLHQRQDLGGRFGAMDQIFPHELLHVIARQLAGEPPAGGANQVHALAVRTDPIVAFAEGFAEHAQVMAVDAPDALPETRALARDSLHLARATERLAAYARAVGARWALAPRATMTFPLWFSGTEQVLRYHAVKQNLFVREPRVPDWLLDERHAYRAYLLANVLPGEPRAPRRPPAVSLSTEGVVSTLFWRWVNDPDLQRARPPDFYAPFGVHPEELEPLDHTYLKLFHVLGARRPADAASFVRAYRGVFTDEAAAVDRIVAEVLGAPLPDPTREIWLANQSFTTGTSLFDQCRALPRVHTFDLNAATVVDLAGVPGVDRALARSIVAHAPYASVADLARVPGLTAATAHRFVAMATEMDRQRAVSLEEETVLRLRDILLPYLWRALVVWAGTALVATLIYRRARRVRWWRASLAGAAAALVGLLVGWLADPGSGLVTLVAPVVFPGVPAAALCLARRQPPRVALHILVAWLAAALPAAVAVRPWG